MIYHIISSSSSCRCRISCRTYHRFNMGLFICTQTRYHHSIIRNAEIFTFPLARGNPNYINVKLMLTNISVPFWNIFQGLTKKFITFWHKSLENFINSCLAIRDEWLLQFWRNLTHTNFLRSDLTFVKNASIIANHSDTIIESRLTSRNPTEKITEYFIAI